MFSLGSPAHYFTPVCLMVDLKKLIIVNFLSMVPDGEGKFQNTANTPFLQVHTLQMLLFRDESMW